jgi:very-short-patch-repair endonuclease
MKRIIITCQNCGNPFEDWASAVNYNRRFCSKACWYEKLGTWSYFKDKLGSGHRTKPEKIAEQIIQQLGVQYDFEHRFGRYWVDFYLPEYHWVVECDEPYWHNNLRDMKRDQYLRERYNLIVTHLKPVELETRLPVLLERLMQYSRHRGVSP